MDFIGKHMDYTSGIPKSIDPISACMNEGHLFSCNQVSAALAQNGTVLYEILTDGANCTRLISLDIWSTEVYQESELIEAPTLVTGSSVLTAYNIKRPSSELPKTVIKPNPTSISGGTQIGRFWTGGGSGVGQSKISGGSTYSLGWILKPETTYLLRIINKSANACYISTVLTFGEM